ncbi:MAG TPA: hypothetical protein VLJ59_12890 [Mycobacteriales bacterium]|nr:hypothetical protein [Mycobacteriales bacterium]
MRKRVVRLLAAVLLIVAGVAVTAVAASATGADDGAIFTSVPDAVGWD